MKKFKKVIVSTFAVVLAALLSISTVSGVTLGNGVSYYSDSNEYVANKVSHKDKPVKTADGIVDYAGNSTVTDQIDENIGDRAQSYSWSAVGYGDYMYIGTCANAMTNTLALMKSALGDKFDDETMTAAINAAYNGTFFTTEEDGGNPNGILVKLNIKTGDVKLLMSKATTGTNCLFRNAVEYNGKLYFCGSVNGIPSIYMVNPETDDYKCVYQSLTLQEYAQAFKEGICVGIRGMCVFQDKLIVSLIGLDGAYICETATPEDPDSFRVVADMEDLFNYPAYHYTDSIYGGSIWDMVEYNNSLYVTLCTGTPDNKPDENTMQSFALVRADVDENGNWSWTSVAGDQETYGSRYTYGIDPQRTRSGAANLLVYDDYLYIGEYNDEEIAMEDIIFSRNCDFVNANLEQSVNLYRMNQQEDIELVVGDADEMFPEGSLTGIGSGFGRNENQYIWRMQVYDGKLYIGTFDTSSLLEPIGQFTNGDLLNMTPEEWESQINYLIELINVIKSKTQETPEVVMNTGTLTTEEIEKIEKVAENPEVVQQMDENAIDRADEINKLLEELKSMASKKVSQEFLDKYQEVYSMIFEQANGLPDDIQSEYVTVVSDKFIANAMSIIKCAAYLATADRGFDLYTLDKALNVKTVTTNGFGDPYNHGCRVFAVTDQGLTVGTANPFYGTQIWTLEEKSYDINLDGVVNISDVTFAQLVLAQLVDKPDGINEYGDVNHDGRFNIVDAAYVQKYLAKL